MGFGTYKGHQLYLIHIAKSSEGKLQAPLFAPLRKEATWYPELLSCKTHAGFTSYSLDIYSRDGRDVGKDLIHILNRFKDSIRKNKPGF